MYIVRKDSHSSRQKKEEKNEYVNLSKRKGEKGEGRKEKRSSSEKNSGDERISRSPRLKEKERD